MKRLGRNREPWHPPVPLLQVAVFQCRRCHAALTPPLLLLVDASALGWRKDASLVPAGRYFPVPGGQDFAGAFAIALVDLVGVGYHPDARRLIGCCGPNGAGGRNRVCGCGCEVGTERSDCIWPQAVYLDPSQVMATVPHADIELAELLATPIDWIAIPDRPFCFSGTGAGMGYELRLNDFPEESLLTLVLGDVRTVLNDCPRVWRLPRHRGE